MSAKKSLWLFFSFAFLFLVLPAAAQAQDYLGNWISIDGDVKIRFWEQHNETKILVEINTERNSVGQLCWEGASPCELGFGGHIGNRKPGVFTFFGSRSDGSQIDFEFAPQGNSLTWLSTIRYKSGGSMLVQVNFVRAKIASPVQPVAPIAVTAQGSALWWEPGREVKEGSGWKIVSEVRAASESPFRQGECTDYVYRHRSDAAAWAYDAGNAWTWAKLAGDRGLNVDYGDFNKARSGDIVVWSNNCGVTTAGHVAVLVEVKGNTLVVNESNHCDKNGVCDHKTYEGSKYGFTSNNIPCLSFIHQPPGTTVDWGSRSPSTPPQPLEAKSEDSILLRILKTLLPWFFK